MSYLFTSESVSEGHPDKIADQISDALLDAFLTVDSESKVACETLVTTGLVVLAGEVRTEGYVDVQEAARRVINRIGYTKAEYMFDGNSCGVISTIHEQSQDIRQGVVRESPEEQGAGDQGMMFGFACREMDNYMPMPIEIAHILVQELAAIRREGKQMNYLRPDSKSQVTVEYEDDGTPKRIDTIVVSTQHDEFIKPTNQSPEAIQYAHNQMHQIIYNDVKNILIPRVINTLPERVKQLFKDDFKLYVNPTGLFIIGGPHGDTGLTGRKIIVDTYGGRGAHGGGAFSGKDPSKVDRSAAYAMRHIAKNMVAAGICDEVLVQVAYAIGVAHPVGFYVNTFGTAKVKDKQGNILSDGDIAKIIQSVYDMRPYYIIKNLGLKNPIYEPTAAYGHFGRDSYKKRVEISIPNGNGIEKNNCLKKIEKEIEFFTWEKLDCVETFKKAFSLA